MNGIAYLSGLLAIIFYGMTTPIAKKYLFDLPPFAFIALSSSLMMIVCTVVSVMYEKDFVLSKMSSEAWKGIGTFSAINLIGYVLFLFAIQKIPSVHYQIMFLLTPIVSGITAYLLLNEPFKLQYLTGLFFVSIGIFIAIWDWK